MSPSTLRELLRGKGAHVDPVACLEDLSAKLAGEKIQGYPHSIFQIVEHLNYWMEYEIERINGVAREYPQHAIESWPKNVAPGSDAEWMNSVERFRALVSQLSKFSESTPEFLNRMVIANSDKEAASTVETVLWQIMVHNSYHIGQVALLRRCLGVWPPLGGGDSW